MWKRRKNIRKEKNAAKTSKQQTARKQESLLLQRQYSRLTREPDGIVLASRESEKKEDKKRKNCHQFTYSWVWLQYAGPPSHPQWLSRSPLTSFFFSLDLCETKLNQLQLACWFLSSFQLISSVPACSFLIFTFNALQ